MRTPAICAFLAMTAALSPATRVTEQAPPRVSTVMIPLKYLSAVETSVRLGGEAMISGANEAREVDRITARMSGQSLTSLLPQGIESIIGVEWNNSLLVRADDEALKEIKELLRLIDIKPVQVACRADAVLTLRDLDGRPHRSEITALGRAGGAHHTSLRTVVSGETVAGSGGTLSGQSFDLDLYVLPIADGRLHVEAAWTVELQWRTAAARAPIKYSHTFHVTGDVRPGATFEAARSAIKLPGGNAELILRLTPRFSNSASPGS